mmetsp:Transcript_23538/g.35222  ORF Transcript_23538/g.35222 Transcript_23538/m.35222 type:complete len:85 (+) Transcript_23538:971-1225(+)
MWLWVLGFDRYWWFMLRLPQEQNFRLIKFFQFKQERRKSKIPGAKVLESRSYTCKNKVEMSVPFQARNEEAEGATLQNQMLSMQ